MFKADLEAFADRLEERYGGCNAMTGNVFPVSQSATARQSHCRLATKEGF
jgi:hypothetical protein